MNKYRLIKSKDGKRAIIINTTSEVITEEYNPIRYAELRKKAINNMYNFPQNFFDRFN